MYSRYFLHEIFIVRKDIITQNYKTNTFTKLEKIVIHINFKNYNFDIKTQFFPIFIFLENITGQQPKILFSKKDSSFFRLRKGSITSIIVTLRGKKIWYFIESFIQYCYPKLKPFNYIQDSIIDQQKNESYSFNNPFFFIEIEKEFNNYIHFFFKIPCKLDIYISYKNNNLKYRYIHHYQFPQEKLNIK